MTPDPVELLARPDKWYLSAGDGLIYAPPFPVWLDAPGFWDGATIYQYGFAPLFTVAALDEEGREIAMRATGRRWTPADLTVEHRLANGMTATEVRTVQPGGIFVSEWRLQSLRPALLHLVAWTAQDAATVALDSAAWDGALTLRRTVLDRRAVPLLVAAELASVGGAASWAACLSEASAVQPHWRFTPFAERWRPDGLPCEVRLEGISRTGLVYAAVHATVPVRGEGGAAAFAMRLSPADAGLRRALPAEPAPRGGTMAGASRARWQEAFAAVPAFRCTDPYLERYYWYRWYGLRLSEVAGGAGNYRHASVCEGIDSFHQPVSYSAQCHVRELRWRADPELARGVLRTFFGHQRPDGSLHGRIYLNHLTGADFYHADWGGALLALDAVWPDDGFLREMYSPLARYADWLVRARDADGSGLFDVVDQYETGQEYMSRYQAVDPRADTYGWENRIRLKGIDVTVYAYSLLRALERIAARAGAADEAPRWRALAERTAAAVRGAMWDPREEMFFDVDPGTGARTGVKAAVCFYPYFTDLAGAEHVGGLERHLLNPAEFWTEFPVPSSSLDDPLFSAHAEWKGKRHVCPWNGRVWPMVNSHLVEALARTAVTHEPRLRAVAAQLLARFVRMMYHDGELDRPNCYEHYNPFTGRASVYRGIDDYQHSWVADLIIQYAAGVRPGDTGIVVDPFPLGLEMAELTGVRVRGALLDVRIDGERVRVRYDGTEQEGRLGTPLLVTP